MKLSKRLQFFFREMSTVVTDRFFRWCLCLSLIFLLLTSVLPVWRIMPLGLTRPYIPLHYNIYFGIDRLGPWQAIFILPGLGAGLLVFNVFLQAYAVQKAKLLAQMIAVATVLAEVMLFVAMFLIVLLNLSYAA